MHTIKRQKKNDDVVRSVSEIWNQRVKECMEMRDFTRKTFAKAYKEEYGTGNITDVGRWVRVGDYSSDGKIIGFPSYDTMKRIADFFEVTVGYLTGETDCETFELESACSYFSISKAAGHTIEKITKGIGTSGIDRYLRTDRTAALERLLTAESFQELLNGFCEYAAVMYRKIHPIDYLGNICKQYEKDVLDMAWKYIDYPFFDEEDNLELPPNVVEAIHKISEAQDKGFEHSLAIADRVKVERYSLSEILLKLIDEVVNDETVDDLTAHEPFNSVKELKQKLADDNSI